MSAMCKDCGVRWGGHCTEHCSVCHETFTGSAAGDKHRIGKHHDGTRRCAWPADRGLVLRERAGYKVWGWPSKTARPDAWNRASA